LRKHETSTAFETNNENLKRKDHPSRKTYVGNGGSSLATTEISAARVELESKYIVSGILHVL